MKATLTDAISIACEVHRDEKRRNGEDYILHPLRVMMAQKTLVGQILAVLHDVIENSNLTLADMRERGYGPEIIRGLDLLTHDPEDTYKEYIQRIADSLDPFVISVKIADLRDNIDMSHLSSMSAKNIERTSKYVTALEVLLETHREL